MKPVGKVIQEKPIMVHVTKNARPVHESVAKQYVEKTYPEVLSWKFTKTDHSVLAEENI
jgi:hypothetical protein